MLRDPPVSRPSVHPLHMAGDNFPEYKSDHVTPPLNIPPLLPQGLEDNVLLWKALPMFMIWPYPFLWPHYVLSLFYSVIHSSPRTLFNSQESHVIITTPRLSHDLPHPPNSLFPLLVDAWPTPTYPLRLNIALLPSGRLSRPLVPGWVYFLSS